MFDVHLLESETGDGCGHHNVAVSPFFLMLTILFAFLSQDVTLDNLLQQWTCLASTFYTSYNPQH